MKLRTFFIGAFTIGNLYTVTLHFKNISFIPDHAFIIQWGQNNPLAWGATNQTENLAPSVIAKDPYFSLRIGDLNYCTKRGVRPLYRFCFNNSAPMKAEDGKVYIITGIDWMGNIMVKY